MVKSLVIGSDENQKLYAQGEKASGWEGESLKARGRKIGISREVTRALQWMEGMIEGELNVFVQFLMHRKEVGSIIRKKGGSVKMVCGERGVYQHLRKELC